MSLTLDVEAEVVGYLSDGTAHVNIIASLRNKGKLRSDDMHEVVVNCTGSVDARCSDELSIRLADGFGPATENVTATLPMGTTVLEFNYGGASTLALEVDVPERILGVDRAVWDCYSDRSPGDEDDDRSCSGWGEWTTVLKWLNDVPVKVWVTGDSRYVEVFEEVMDYLTPMLALEFQRVGTEEEADFKAYVGISRSESESYGFDRGATVVVDYAGFASWGDIRGETTSAYIVVWANEDPKWDAYNRDGATSVILHEVFHAMASIGHTSRPASILGGSGLKWLSPMDEALVRLNAHYLVEPGMTMPEVESLIVFREDLLDEAKASEPSILGMLWQASVGLLEAGSARFKMRGGWTDTDCNLTFGTRRGLATYETVFEAFEDEPPLVHFDDHTSHFYIIWDEASYDWRRWLNVQGDWKMIDHEALLDSTHWWPSNGRLTQTLRSLLNDAASEDIAVVDRSNGTITLEATLDASYPTLRELIWWELNDDEVNFRVVLDDESYAIEGYRWQFSRGQSSGGCDTYEDEVSEVELGVKVEIPESIRQAIESP